ncbi:MAG: acyl-ACP--UDP-N-acetylglucosamine O-acyltransferase [Halanaerobiaceae bacterium]
MDSSKNHEHKLLRMAQVHETATIHPEAIISRDVEIDPYVTIGENVEIGKGTVIGPHVVLDGQTVIGKNNRIYHGAALGVKSENRDEKGSLFVGDNNIIRENVTIQAGSEGQKTKIGNNNFIMAYCHVTENCRLGNNIIMSNAVNLGKNVVIEDQAQIGGLSTLQDNVRVGRIAMVGGHSRINSDIPPYLLVDGHHNLRVKVNVIGLRRNGFKPWLRKEIKKIYKIVYRSGFSVEEAIEKIREEISDCESCTEIKEFIDFLENSSKGIVNCK